MTGLVTGAFTLTLRRRSGANLISSSETVSVQEISGGEYWVYYTPTAAATLYILDVAMVSASYQVSPGQFQDDIQSTAATTSGPYLTTRDAFKLSWGITRSDDDARIDALLAQVTTLFETTCGRGFALAQVTEYPRILGHYLRRVFLARPPYQAMTSLHLSTSVPRVYDSTTLLVEGTDYIVEESSGIVEFQSPREVCGPLMKVVRAIYTGGYDPIPSDLERAAQEVIGVKLDKGKGHLYHVLNESRADGSISGVRFDDITPNAQAVIDRYTLQAVA